VHGGRQSPEGSRDTALASLVLLFSFPDRPVDPDQLRHTLGNGSELLDPDDLVRLARKLDARARKVAAKSTRLAGIGSER
jgi:ABC-type bacteriocin/lantibiotic exporter with double-glycine peptidase domain